MAALRCRATATGAPASAAAVAFGHYFVEGLGGEDLRAGDRALGAVGGAAGLECRGGCAEDLVLCSQTLDFALQAFFLGQDAGVGGGEVVELDF